MDAALGSYGQRAKRTALIPWLLSRSPRPFITCPRCARTALRGFLLGDVRLVVSVVILKGDEGFRKAATPPPAFRSTIWKWKSTAVREPPPFHLDTFGEMRRLHNRNTYNRFFSMCSQQGPGIVGSTREIHRHGCCMVDLVNGHPYSLS